MKSFVPTLMFSLISFFLFADDPPSLSIQYTGNFGPFFRGYSIPTGTRFSVVKAEPFQIKELLEKDLLRMAITSDPPNNSLKWKVTKLALHAPILAVHPENPIRDICSANAVALLKQQYGSWRPLGGPLTRIHLYRKADSSLPQATVRTCSCHTQEHAHDKDKEKEKEAKEKAEKFSMQFSKPLLLQTENDNKSFSLLFTDPSGIACFDITRYDEKRVPLLSIDKIPPTLAEFESGRYPLLTTYYLVESATPSPVEKHLAKYILSREFSLHLYEEGFLPFPRKTTEKLSTSPQKARSNVKTR